MHLKSIDVHRLFSLIPKSDSLHLSNGISGLRDHTRKINQSKLELVLRREVPKNKQYTINKDNSRMVLVKGKNHVRFRN